MRTTINIDEDVAAAVEHLRRERGLGISEAVNQLARQGLSRKPRRAQFRQRTARIGLAVDVRNIAEALETLDGSSGR